MFLVSFLGPITYWTTYQVIHAKTSPTWLPPPMPPTLFGLSAELTLKHSAGRMKRAAFWMPFRLITLPSTLLSYIRRWKREYMPSLSQHFLL